MTKWQEHAAKYLRGDLPGGLTAASDTWHALKTGGHRTNPPGWFGQGILTGIVGGVAAIGALGFLCGLVHHGINGPHPVNRHFYDDGVAPGEASQWYNPSSYSSSAKT